MARPEQKRRVVAPQRDKDPATGKFLPKASPDDDPRRTGALGGIEDLEDTRSSQQRRNTLPPPSEYDQDDDIDDAVDDQDPDPGFDEERLSRDQESRENDDIHDDYDDKWAQPRLLEAPEPRPGFVQRWIRAEVGNNPDARNYQRALHRGWQPRLADTVPKNHHVPSIAHGQWAGHIRVEGMVLMEMRKDRFVNRVRKPTREKTRRLEGAIHRDLDRQTQNVAGQGFGTPSLQSKTRVTHGGGRRTVAPADDD